MRLGSRHGCSGETSRFCARMGTGVWLSLDASGSGLSARSMNADQRPAGDLSPVGCCAGRLG